MEVNLLSKIGVDLFATNCKKLDEDTRRESRKLNQTNAKMRSVKLLERTMMVLFYGNFKTS